MKYVAIIDSGDKELSEDAIEELNHSTFFDDDETPYRFEMTSIKEAPKEEVSCCDAYLDGYNQALRDCGVLKDD